MDSILYTQPGYSIIIPDIVLPVGQGDVIGPDVELEPLPPDYPAEDGAGVDPDPHVDLLVAVLVKLLDGLDHAQPHLNTVARVVLPGLRTSLTTEVSIL